MTQNSNNKLSPNSPDDDRRHLDKNNLTIQVSTSNNDDSGSANVELDERLSRDKITRNLVLNSQDPAKTPSISNIQQQEPIRQNEHLPKDTNYISKSIHSEHWFSKLAFLIFIGIVIVHLALIGIASIWINTLPNDSAAGAGWILFLLIASLFLTVFTGIGYGVSRVISRLLKPKPSRTCQTNHELNRRIYVDRLSTATFGISLLLMTAHFIDKLQLVEVFSSDALNLVQIVSDFGFGIGLFLYIATFTCIVTGIRSCYLLSKYQDLQKNNLKSIIFATSFLWIGFIIVISSAMLFSTGKKLVSDKDLRSIAALKAEDIGFTPYVPQKQPEYKLINADLYNSGITYEFEKSNGKTFKVFLQADPPSAKTICDKKIALGDGCKEMTDTDITLYASKHGVGATNFYAQLDESTVMRLLTHENSLTTNDIYDIVAVITN